MLHKGSRDPIPKRPHSISQVPKDVNGHVNFNEPFSQGLHFDCCIS